MNWLQQKLQCLKQKWWLPVSATVVLLLSFVLKPKNTKIKTVNKNRELDKDIEDLEIKALREENDRKKEAMARAGVKVQTLNDEKKRKELEMLEKKKQRIRELATRSNKELAEILKKENEV